MSRCFRLAQVPAAVLLVAVAVTMMAGVQTPPVNAQSPGVHIAGATSNSPLQLTRGCNQVIADSPNGVPVAGLATLISPASAVLSIWRYNNATQSYTVGFFANSAAPVDFASTGSTTAGRSTESYFICVSQSATMLSG